MEADENVLYLDCGGTCIRVYICQKSSNCTIKNGCTLLFLNLPEYSWLEGNGMWAV